MIANSENPITSVICPWLISLLYLRVPPNYDQSDWVWWPQRLWLVYNQVTERGVARACVYFPQISNISINTQVIIQNRALSLARYLELSADNHLDGQNGCQ